MRAVSVLLVVVLQSSAHAQPAPASPSPYPQGQPYPQAQPYPPAPYPPGVIPPYQYIPAGLTPEEQELLAEGEMPNGRYLGGAIASIFFGLGVGQAVQGRYGETGWIFTLGEIGSATLLTVGAIQSFECFLVDEDCREPATAGPFFFGGLIGLIGFRTWEIVDAFVVPSRRNARVRALRLRLGMPPPLYTTIRPYVAPILSRDGGATAGVTFRF